MRLSEEEIDRVRGSFWHLARVPEETAALFYDRLFLLAPELRRLFPADLEEQGVKLMSMLGSIVARLHDHATLLPMVADLGRRHVEYGAEPEHYALVGAALIGALGQALGAGFTPEVEAAWRKAFDGLAETMIAASA